MNIQFGLANYANKLSRTAEALTVFDSISVTKRGIPPGTRNAATVLAQNIRIEDALARYSQLMEAKDYSGAIFVVDERIALSPNEREIKKLREHRTELENIRDFLHAEKLLADEHKDEAERILVRLSKEAVGEQVRTQAASRLAGLSRSKTVAN